jgi:hypothetical protein
MNNLIYRLSRKQIFIAGYICVWFMLSCGKETDSKSQPTQEAIVDISSVETKLPLGEGVNLVQANCMICHSLRYIEMQPHLSAKSWEKIVDKMIKNFGAPVPDSASRGAIIKYLVAIR